MAKAVQAMVERIVEDHDENPGDAGRQRSCRRSNGWPTAVEMRAWAPAPVALTPGSPAKPSLRVEIPGDAACQ